MQSVHSGAVILLISRRIKADARAEFEQGMAQFIAVAQVYPGCRGAQLIVPEQEEGGDQCLYHVLMAFTDGAARSAWQQSVERRAGLEQIAPYVEGDTTERGFSGLDHWFQAAPAVAVVPPPRWKIAIVTWLGIFPTVLTLFWLLSDWLAPWPLVARIFVLTILVVVIMTWGLAPRITRLLKPWLYPPLQGEK